MPFRWKKAKGSSKFSQFVADHLRSSKQRGSLVVETGFPTSLVDIFVKNRDRMRKSPKENHCPNPATVTHFPDPIVPTSMPPSNPPNSQPQLGSVANCRMADEIIESGVPDFSNNNAEDCMIPNVSRSATCDGHAKTGGGVGLLMSGLKIFLVVCLALGTKRFVIGITLSAFALFFLELVGNKLFRNVHTSSDSIKKNESIVEGLDVDINGGLRMESDIVNVCSDFSEHSGEIHIVKTKSSPEQILSSGISLNDSDEIWVCEEDLNLKECLEKEEESSYEVPELLKHQCSRRAKMKSKMKKLIHKNLRKSKKACSSLKSEGSGPLSGLLESDTFEHQEQCNMVLDCQGEEHEQCKSMVLVSQEEKQLSCKKLHGCGQVICSHGESSLGEVEAIAKVENEMEKPIKKGLGGYMGLCLIVLFGLVGGRIIALVLALSWCLLLKMLARRRSIIR